jgi:hypothetical protein
LSDAAVKLLVKGREKDEGAVVDELGALGVVRAEGCETVDDELLNFVMSKVPLGVKRVELRRCAAVAELPALHATTSEVILDSVPLLRLCPSLPAGSSAAALTHLTLTRGKLTNESFTSLSPSCWPSLLELRVESQALTSASAVLAALVGAAAPSSSKQPTLRTLSLSHNPLGTDGGDDDLQLLEGFPSLVEVSLASAGLSSIPFALLELPRLKVVQLQGNDLLTRSKDRQVAKFGKVVAKAKSPKEILKWLRSNDPRDDEHRSRTKAELRRAAAREEKAARAAARVVVTVPATPDEVHTIVAGVGTDLTRPHLVACLVDGLDLADPEVFRYFIDVQTAIHSAEGDRRRAAALGVHDASALRWPLSYEAQDRRDVRLIPLREELQVLGPKTPMTGDAFETALINSGDSSMISYLGLIASKPWACVVDAEGVALSVPPVMNSAHTRVTHATTQILLEVTSDRSMEAAESVGATFLHRLSVDLQQQIRVQQIVVTSSEDGRQLSRFPSPQVVQTILGRTDVEPQFQRAEKDDDDDDDDDDESW